MHAILHWILILHVLHLPVPFPDLDGECRGAPIHSLAEAHAWHVMILGVSPNEDIDQGPIRTSDDGFPEAPLDSLFGDPAINATSSVACLNAAFLTPALSILPQYVSANASAPGNSDVLRYERTVVDTASAQSVRSRLCVWCV